MKIAINAVELGAWLRAEREALGRTQSWLATRVVHVTYDRSASSHSNPYRHCRNSVNGLCEIIWSTS